MAIMTGGNHEGAQPTLHTAVALADKARALSYALVRVLASSPRDELSREDLDALCQLATNMTGGNHEGTEPTRRLLAAVALVDEAHALSYALVRLLASSPRDELSREDLDALCQLAYELLNKLTKAQEVFQAIDKSSDT